MIYTKYDNMRDHELLREVDSKPDATELEIELAKRLEGKMHRTAWPYTSPEAIMATRLKS